MSAPGTVVVDDFEDTAAAAGWDSESNVVRTTANAHEGTRSAFFDDPSHLIGGDGLAATMAEGRRLTWRLLTSYFYSLNYAVEICATYDGSWNLVDGYRLVSLPGAYTHEIHRFEGGTSAAVVGSGEVSYAGVGFDLYEWDYTDGTHTIYGKPIGAEGHEALFTATDSTYTTGDMGFRHIASADYHLDYVTVQGVQTGVPVTGTVTFDDETPIENATVIGINDTQGTIEDVATTGPDGSYELSMTPGDTAHLIMEYDTGTEQYQTESKPFVVVTE